MLSIFPEINEKIEKLNELGAIKDHHLTPSLEKSEDSS